MKAQQLIKLIVILSGGVVFNYLFWQEDLGLNLAIFSTILIIVGIVSNPNVLKSFGGIFALTGMVLTAIFTLMYGSFIAKLIHFLSLLVFVGMLSQPKLKAAFHAIPTAVTKLVLLPMQFANQLLPEQSGRGRGSKYWKTLRLVVIPFAFFLVFYGIFYLANPVFQSYSDNVWNTVGDWFYEVFKDISFAWFMLLLLGVAAMSWVMLKADLPYFRKLEESYHTHIKRKIGPKKYAHRHRAVMMGLKNEYRMALYLIVSINALLLVVNAIDVNWIWFNFEYDGRTNLSQFVHEGTYLLIFSILLSMGILLFFFRKNLNFFPENTWLKRFAQFWVLQNLILVVSVGIRNYHYIYYFGLAYKRIGVIVFLTATLVGLITLFMKIRDARTTWFLLKINSWSVYGMLLFMSFFNWDMVIVKHNVTYTSQAKVDVRFLMSLSDKTIPVLDANRERLKLDSYYPTRQFASLGQQLDVRMMKYVDRNRDKTWKSWNHSDAQALEYCRKRVKSWK